MTTFIATRAEANFPVSRPAPGSVGFAWGVIEIATNPVAADIYHMCRVPKGAVVIDGFVRADDLETGSDQLDMDVGWAANGTDSADPDGFGNLGTWTGTAVTNVRPETQVWYPFNGVLKDGPKTFAAETVIQVTAVTAAHTGGTGTLYVGVYYIVP